MLKCNNVSGNLIALCFLILLHSSFFIIIFDKSFFDKSFFDKSFIYYNIKKTKIKYKKQKTKNKKQKTKNKKQKTKNKKQKKQK
jgi:hypothetical protein